MNWTPGPLVACAALALSTAGAIAATSTTPATVLAAAAPAYVGSAACAPCHTAAYQAWMGSQHTHAMAEATEESVLGDFSGVSLTQGPSVSTFLRRDGRFIVRTDGPDGRLGEFEVRYTFGLAPLQQYLVELPGGRLQALGVAWDSRPQGDGGQRWFSLYPDQDLHAGDPLHWTGIEQNWNHQCADCHSTGVRKNYDATTAQYHTTWTEISVGCEACHGPGSRHIAWAEKGPGHEGLATTLGLTVALDGRKGVTWSIDAQTGLPTRTGPGQAHREIEVCARCHARRGQLTEGHHAGQPFLDAFLPALLDDALYHPDGQQRDEVYTYGSFLQSRMHAKGVTCSDCHDPHGGKVRAPGNPVCTRCHPADRYDAPAHHHHPKDSSAGLCVTCHMPTTPYMGVDPRHDHSIRIPRPDQAAALGTPDACTGCHTHQTPQWAAEALQRWYPQSGARREGIGSAFAAADRGDPRAHPRLIELAGNPEQPAIVRASALQRLGRRLDDRAAAVASQSLGDRDALVRMAAVRALAGLPPPNRAHRLGPMLNDPIRAVRIEAVQALAGAAGQGLTGEARQGFDLAQGEFLAAQRLAADRPEAHVALGEFYRAMGNAGEAEAAYQTALRIDPTYAIAAANLADLQRELGRDAAAEATLRAALVRNAGSAPLHHALGLARVRQRHLPEAIVSLTKAAELAPETPRYGFVLGVAMHGAGDVEGALRVLRANLERHPWDEETLGALAAYSRDARDQEGASGYVRRLREIEAAEGQAVSTPLPQAP